MKKIIFATVCNLLYLRYGYRLLKSILANNPEFDNDFYFICDKPFSFGIQNGLRSVYPQVKFKYVETDFYDSCDKTDPRYYSFSAFNISADRVIFLDADMLCIGNIDALRNGSFSESGISMVRERDAEDTFNAGLIVIPSAMLGCDVFNALVESDYSKAIRYGTDQKVYNEHFHGNINELPSEWNVLVTEYDSFAEKEKIKFIHYCHKPDNPETFDFYSARRDLIDVWNKYL